MKVFVTRAIPGTAIDKLKKSEHQVDISKVDRPLEEEELIKQGVGADALLTLLTDKITPEIMDAIGPQLKVISNYAVGFNNVDVDAATNKGIVVANTPSDEVNEAVAEFAWSLMLALAKRVVEADEAARRSVYKGWGPGIFLGKNMIGKTLGIVGLGRIGSMVARRAKGYQMRILYNKRSRDEEAEKELGVEFAQLDQLLGESDFVTLHVPLTKETHHMMNKDTIYKMKRGSYLINTARGPVINEDALVNALREGHLAGAALDVFENEPDVNPELVGMENVVLTPHIASATWEAREKMGHMAVDAVLATLSGNKPENIVNDDVWDNRRK
jgi:glyoxylate reductase